MSDDIPVLEVRGLTRSFGSATVLDGVDIRLEPGRRLGLTGANGSGKTTLLRCIAGSLTPSAGQIEVAGHPSGSLPARAAIGVTVAHEKAFYQRLSGRRNLMFYASLRVPEPREAAESVIEEMQLEFAGERVDRYSSGMVQQLSFARALLGDPKLLLLDEPTRSLDESASERLWAALSRRPSVAVVMATHQSEDVDRCEQRLELS